MALSPFENTILSGLFGDPELAGWLSEDADIKAMLRFEAALAEAQAEHGLIPADAASAISALCADFAPDMDQLRKGVAQDGVIIPNFVKQLRAALPEHAAKHVHFGATSQDAIDTGLVLRLAPIADILQTRLQKLGETLTALEAKFGTNKLMGRTRMQDALEISVADRIRDWAAPFARDLDRLDQLRSRLLVLQLGGAVGTLEKFGPQSSAIVASVACRLGLKTTEKSWHNQRDSIVEFAGWMALVAGSAGKLGQDVALLAQNARGEVKLAGGGGSSAMPHKSNPVAAEVLVSLARYVAGGSGAMAQTMVHEQERSGAAWTLEWLVLPEMIVATGSALLLCQRLLDSVESLGQA